VTGVYQDWSDSKWHKVTAKDENQLVEKLKKKNESTKKGIEGYLIPSDKVDKVLSMLKSGHAGIESMLNWSKGKS